MFVLGDDDFRSIRDGDMLSIAPDGAVTVENSNRENPKDSEVPEISEKKV